MNGNLGKLAALSLLVEGEEEKELKEKIAKKFGLPSPDLDGLKEWVRQGLQEAGAPAEEEDVRRAISGNIDLLRLAFILAGGKKEGSQE